MTTVLVVETATGERYQYSAWLVNQPSLNTGQWVHVESLLNPYVWFAHFFLMVEGEEGLLLAAKDAAYGVGGRPPTEEVGGVSVNPEGSVVGREMSLCARDNYRMAGFAMHDQEAWLRPGESALLGTGDNQFIVANHYDVWSDYVECTDMPWSGFGFSIVRQAPK